MPSLIAVVPLGLERLAAKEIRALGGGIGKTEVGTARVAFEGPEDAVYRANLQLRLAERIVRPICEGYAPDFDLLAEVLRQVDWAKELPRDLPLRVVASARACRLYHTGAIEDCVRTTLEHAGIRCPAPDPEHRGPVVTLDLRGTGNRWAVALDTTGRALHRRGYRLKTAKAPLRENLAAALLLAAGWTGTTPLLDPACGAGTIAIEAALLARRRAPGLGRPFLFQHLPGFDPERWAALVQDAEARESAVGCPSLEGADATAGAIRAAKDNARRAGVLDILALRQRAIEDTPKVDGPGLVLANLPFGLRVDGGDDLPAQWARWGDRLRERRAGWRLLLLAPGRELAEAAGARARPLIRFPHGGVDVGLYDATGA